MRTSILFILIFVVSCGTTVCLDSAAHKFGKWTKQWEQPQSDGRLRMRRICEVCNWEESKMTW